jgi:hypothetical protein
MFDSFADRDERKRLTRSELVGNGSAVTEVSVVPPTRLRAASIFVQQRMTIDRQVGYPVPAFDETVAEPMERRWSMCSGATGTGTVSGC